MQLHMQSGIEGFGVGSPRSGWGIQGIKSVSAQGGGDLRRQRIHIIELNEANSLHENAKLLLILQALILILRGWWSFQDFSDS